MGTCFFFSPLGCRCFLKFASVFPFFPPTQPDSDDESVAAPNGLLAALPPLPATRPAFIANSDGPHVPLPFASPGPAGPYDGGTVRISSASQQQWSRSADPVHDNSPGWEQGTVRRSAAPAWLPDDDDGHHHDQTVRLDRTRPSATAAAAAYDYGTVQLHREAVSAVMEVNMELALQRTKHLLDSAAAASLVADASGPDHQSPPSNVTMRPHRDTAISAPPHACPTTARTADCGPCGRGQICDVVCTAE